MKCNVVVFMFEYVSVCDIILSFFGVVYTYIIKRMTLNAVYLCDWVYEI